MTDGIIIFIYANPDNYLAGARFSCISQVSLVYTSGVWIVRNFPPQSIVWIEPLYYMLSIICLCFFVKNIFISKQTIPFLLIYFHKSNN